MAYTIQDFERGMRDLLISAETDIVPTIRPQAPEGGHFGVIRSVLCYIDFLGAVFAGWKGERDKKGRKKLSDSKKATDFVKKVFGEVDKQYQSNGELLYEMYRHGTVHLYSPQRLKSKNKPNKTIEWLIYKGRREEWDYYENRAIKLRHLQIIKWDQNRFILPVSISVLYADLIAAIHLYSRMVKTDKSGNLLKKYGSVIDALINDPDPTEFKFWS